jgi:hypothetical protein
MNKSTKLTDTLDSTKIVKKYLKAIKETDWKAADRLAKLFPYLLTKPKWVKDEFDPKDVQGLVIELGCGNLETCTYCKEKEDQKDATEARERTADEYWRDLPKEEKIKLLEKQELKDAHLA